jgi:RNA polymerase primary sigma factor
MNHADYASINPYLQRADQTPRLSAEDEYRLSRLVRRGDAAARDQMIRANLLLVVKIAFNFYACGVSLEDLICDGNIGLVKAVDRYRPRPGTCRFSTYGSWWIRQEMRRSVQNSSRLIRLPVGQYGRLSQLRRVGLALYGKLGREPTIAEVADEAGLSVNSVAHLKAVSANPTSLDGVSGEDDRPRGAFVTDTRPDPSVALQDANSRAHLAELIARLPKREAEVIRLRFGLNGCDEQTLTALGRTFRVSRERVRQLESLALKKLRRWLPREDHEFRTLERRSA